jgi:hypothetical protein
MTKYEILEDIISDYIVKPIFMLTVIIVLLICGLAIILVLPFSQFTLFLHNLNKRREKEKDDQFDAELDELIEKLQIEALKEENKNEIQ